MTYSVLLVDDEPIILSGIKYIIDWKAHGCEVVATARNGEQALALIDSLHPQIVMADIRMPVMDGLQLLKQCSEMYADVVFIMLTSLEEFLLVKEAMRYHAIEYLVKTELDETVLARALKAAIAEYERRSNASSYRLRDTLAEQQEGELAAKAITRVHKSGEMDRQTAHVLTKKGMLDSYALLSLAIIFPLDETEKAYTPQERERLCSWIGEVATKVLPTYAPKAMPITPALDAPMRFLWFCHDLDARRWKQHTPSLKEKLASAARMVTGLEVQVFATAIYSTSDALPACLQAMEEAYNRWYLHGDEQEYGTLDLDGVYAKVEQEISEQRVSGFSATIERISERIASRAHRKGQALWLVDGLLVAIEDSLATLEGDAKAHALLSPLKELRPYLAQRDDVLAFIAELEDLVVPLLGSASSEKLQIVGRAKGFIHAHVQQKIMLAEVADAAFVSAGYLSSLFKRIVGMSVVDYINECKVEEAKRLMNGGMGRINEIALTLGFENIYYFSKVFKRVVGMPPTQFLRQLKGERTRSTSTDPNAPPGG